MIDMKGMCTFCLGTADASIINGDGDPLYNFKDCWPHFRIKSGNEFNPSGSSPIFLVKGRMTEIPPMCKDCIMPAKEVGECHQQIKELEEKLEELRKKLDEAVKVIKGSIEHSHSKNSSVRFSDGTAKFLRTLMGDKNSRDLSVAKESPISPTPPICSELEEEVEELEEKVKTESEGSSDEDAECEAFGSTDSNSESDTATELEAPTPKRRKLSPSPPNDPLLGEPKEEVETPELDEVEFVEITSEYEDDSGDEYIIEKFPSQSKKEKKDPLSSPTERIRGGKPHSKFRCMICKEKINLKINYEHMRGHVGDFAYQCPGCTLTFPSRYSPSYVERHFAKGKSKSVCKKAPPRKIICDVCNEDVTPGGHVAVSRHFDKHETQEKKYKCPLPSCDASFTHRQSVECHLCIHDLRYKKSMRKQDNQSENLGHRYRTCEFCGERVSFSTALMLEHMQSHVGDYAYQCPEKKCGLVFLCRYSRACCDSYKIHRRTCTLPPPQINCDTCGIKIPKSKVQQLGPHLKRHETLQKNFNCPVASCGESFTTRQSVEFHLRTHDFSVTQKMEMQVCSLCDYTTSKARIYPTEMEAHLKEAHQFQVQDILKCMESYCPYVFPNQEELLQHKISLHLRSSGKTRCDLCDSHEVFTFARTLKAHYFKEHQIGSKLLCEVCNKTFSTSDSLRKHIQSAHKVENPKHKCEVAECGRSFSCASSLEAHNIREHGAEPLKCKFCSKTFNATTQLLNHEKYEHMGVEKPTYSCPTCSTVLRSRKNLKLHLQNVHRDPLTPQFKCSECDRVFKSEQSRVMHVKRIHEQDTSLHPTCDLCGKTLKGQKQLEVHMLIHTGERPYVCTLCGMRFRQNSALFNHNKSHKRMGNKFVPKKTFDRTPR